MRLNSIGFAPRLAALYAALFCTVGIQLPFFPLWLKAKGLEAQAIGVVLALPMVVRIIAIPAAARVADRGGALRGTMAVALLAATFGYVAIGLSNGLATIAVVFALASAALSPVMPLAETYAFAGLRHRSAYGPVRLWGSAAFIAGTFVAGYVADALPARDLIWLIAGAVGLSALAAAALQPVSATHVVEPAKARQRRLLTDPVFVSVIAGASLIQASHAVYYGFSTLAWSQAGLNGTAIAALWALGVAAEIVLFALSGRLPPVVTPLALIMLGGGAGILRWTAMAFDPPLLLLPLLQLLHGLTFGATHLGALGFISRMAPQGRGAMAQGYYAIVSGGVTAAMMGVSGWVFAGYGASAYFAMALAAIAGCACGAVAHKAHRTMV